MHSRRSRRSSPPGALRGAGRLRIGAGMTRGRTVIVEAGRSRVVVFIAASLVVTPARCGSRRPAAARLWRAKIAADPAPAPTGQGTRWAGPSRVAPRRGGPVKGSGPQLWAGRAHL